MDYKPDLFLYIDDCIDSTRRFMNSDFNGPINIGSEEMVSINELAKIAAEISGKNISLKHIDGPLGVRGRNSNNDLIRETLNWNYEFSLKQGISETFKWIDEQVNSLKKVDQIDVSSNFYRILNSVTLKIKDLFLSNFINRAIYMFLQFIKRLFGKTLSLIEKISQHDI